MHAAQQRHTVTVVAGPDAMRSKLANQRRASYKCSPVNPTPLRCAADSYSWISTAHNQREGSAVAQGSTIPNHSDVVSAAWRAYVRTPTSAAPDRDQKHNHKQREVDPLPGARVRKANDPYHPEQQPHRGEKSDMLSSRLFSLHAVLEDLVALLALKAAQWIPAQNIHIL
jgi:hypothetical protein